MLLQALRAWVNDVEHPHDPHDDHDPPPSASASADKTREQMLRELDVAAGVDWDADHRPWNRERVPGEDLADAIVGICGGYLTGRAAAAENPKLDPWYLDPNWA